MTQDAGNQRRLFELPEYDRAAKTFMSDALDALLIAKDPVLQKIRFEKREAMSATATDLDAGGQHLQEPMPGSVTLEFFWQPIVAGDYTQMIEALDSAAQERVAQLMPQLFKAIGTLSDAAGQTVDAGGQSVSFELVLQMYERLDIDFDENDQPKLQTIVTGPVIHEKLKKIFEQVTPEQKNAFDDLIERKRKEFHARRRTRRIP